MAHINARDAKRYGLRQWLCRDVLFRAVMGVASGTLLTWEIVLCVAYATVSPTNVVNAGCAACHFFAAILSLAIAIYGMGHTFDPGNWTYAFISFGTLIMDFASLCISVSYLNTAPRIDMGLVARSTCTQLSTMISLLVLFVYLLLLWASARSPRVNDFFQTRSATPAGHRPLKLGKPKVAARGRSSGKSNEWSMQDKYSVAKVPLAKLDPGSLPLPPSLKVDSGLVPSMQPPKLANARMQDNKPDHSSNLRHITYLATLKSEPEPEPSAPRLPDMRFSGKWYEDDRYVWHVKGKEGEV